MWIIGVVRVEPNNIMTRHCWHDGHLLWNYVNFKRDFQRIELEDRKETFTMCHVCTFETEASKSLVINRCSIWVLYIPYEFIQRSKVTFKTANDPTLSHFMCSHKTSISSFISAINTTITPESFLRKVQFRICLFFANVTILIADTSIFWPHRPRKRQDCDVISVLMKETDSQFLKVEIRIFHSQTTIAHKMKHFIQNMRTFVPKIKRVSPNMTCKFEKYCHIILWYCTFTWTAFFLWKSCLPTKFLQILGYSFVRSGNNFTGE